MDERDGIPIIISEASESCLKCFRFFLGFAMKAFHRLGFVPTNFLYKLTP